MIKDPPFLVTAFANRLGKPSPKAAESLTPDDATRSHRDIGPIGTAARLLVGLLLVSLIVYGQLATSGHLTPITWALGLLGFPAIVLAWHVWRIRRNPARFSDTSPLSFVLPLDASSWRSPTGCCAAATRSRAPSSRPSTPWNAE